MHLHPFYALRGEGSRRPVTLLSGPQEADILKGDFAAEWTREQRRGLARFQQLKREALAHPLNAVEERVLARLAAVKG